MTEDQPEYDRGTTGPAMSVRDSYMREIEGKSRGSAQPGEAIEVKCYTDATLFDRMHNTGTLTDRQHAVARRLARMWTRAGLNPRVVAHYSDRHWRGPEEEPEDPEAPTPLDEYRAIMRECPVRFCMAMEALLAGQFGAMLWVGTVRDGLDWLGDAWGMDRAGDLEGGE